MTAARRVAAKPGAKRRVAWLVVDFKGDVVAALTTKREAVRRATWDDDRVVRVEYDWPPVKRTPRRTRGTR